VQSKNNFLGGEEHVSREAERSRSPLQRTNFTEEPESSVEASTISSNVEFLRAMEDEDPSKKKEKRLSTGSKHIKRASMPSISLSSTKSLLAGRFGDAFRRFETNMGGNNQRASSLSSEQREKILTPITGSEATDGQSDDGHVFEETEPISPELRRELERRRLSQEEKRVADAAAAYRQKFSHMPGTSRERPNDEQSHSRAASIQSKVKTLLDQNGSMSPGKTDAGHGYSSQQTRQNSYFSDEPTLRAAVPQNLKKTTPYTSSHETSKPNPSSINSLPNPRNAPVANPSSSLSSPMPPSTTSTDRPSSRPSAPPKPHALRTGNRETDLVSSAPSTKPTSSTNPTPAPRQPGGVISPGGDDWEKKFSQKYPSLAGLEMVEREINLA
jgi:AP2-associated kinase